MLNQSVFIFNPQSLGDGQYSVELYFIDSNMPKYLAIGDYVEDTNGNQYEIVDLSTPFSDGDTAVVQFVTNDVSPLEDVDYNSRVFSPGQLDLSPEIQTSGDLFNIFIYDAANYEYTVEASWASGTEAAKAVVGDSIVDSSGKEYRITHLEANKFSSPFRIQEVEKIGDSPNVGIATLYRPRTQLGLFLGGPLTDPARTVIRNRDNIILENYLEALGEGGSGGDSNGDWVTESHTVTEGEASAKSFTLSQTPLVPGEVVVLVTGGGGPQKFGADFTISGNTFSWDGLGLDGLLGEGDLVVMFFFK